MTAFTPEARAALRARCRGVEAFDWVARVTNRELLALLDALDAAEAALRVGACVYCDFQQSYESPEARVEAMIDHTVACEKRPEAVLLDRLIAQEKKLDARDALLEDREKMGRLAVKFLGWLLPDVTLTESDRRQRMLYWGEKLAAALRAALAEGASRPAIEPLWRLDEHEPPGMESR